jgi:hypothetical protein
MTRDFTTDAFARMLRAALEAGYRFLTIDEFVAGNPSGRVVMLRHDVDKRPDRSLETARIEQALGIRGTYYFRIVPESFDAQVIRAIAEMGHEIGYHYEDLTLARGNVSRALELFAANLAALRALVPVATACMHGSPSTRWDNRDVWRAASYRDHGVVAEPYFDIDFSRMLYLTDTGRRWDGSSVNVRDHVDSLPHRYHSTWSIIDGFKRLETPDRIMITVHPQRWVDGRAAWVAELIAQSAKNQVKRLIARTRGSRTRSRQ